MATITVQQAHQIGKTAARERLRALEAGVLRQYKVKVTWQPDGYAAALSGPVRGRVLVRDRDVVIQIIPGIAASALVGAKRLEAALVNAARKHLA